MTVTQCNTTIYNVFTVPCLLSCQFALGTNTNIVLFVNCCIGQRFGASASKGCRSSSWLSQHRDHQHFSLNVPVGFSWCVYPINIFLVKNLMMWWFLIIFIGIWLHKFGIRKNGFGVVPQRWKEAAGICTDRRRYRDQLRSLVRRLMNAEYNWWNQDQWWWTMAVNYHVLTYDSIELQNLWLQLIVHLFITMFDDISFKSWQFPMASDSDGVMDDGINHPSFKPPSMKPKNWYKANSGNVLYWNYNYN